MASQMNDPYQRRMFAIGESYQSDITQTYILELDVQGTSVSGFGPFNYAKMLDKETVDDVALVNEMVVFSTRDHNSTSSKVNLRISNVENMLTGSEIDVQWRLRLHSYESVCGRVFVTHLNDKDVCVSYIKYNDNTGEYYMCLNRINLDEIFDSYYRYPIQEMLIPKGEEILDIKYDENKKVLVLLLDKENRQSVFIQALPYLTEAYGATRIETEEGERYFSIDTLQEYYPVFNHSYEAWGGNKCFIQSYADDGTVINSCYPFYKQDVLLLEGYLKTATRTLPRGIENRYFEFEEIPMVQSTGLRECMNQLSDN